jgi:two-component system phosphate regulon sensor histidine kinase PhoR
MTPNTEPEHGSLRQAERSENLLRSILASVAEGLVITDRGLNVLLVNDAARALLGFGARAVTRLTDISRDPQLHRAFNAVLSTGEGSEARLEIAAAETGSLKRRILRLHAAPLRLSEQRVDGVVGAFSDISKIEQLERIRQEFLSNVSHELRTPLAAVTAYVETLLDGGLEDSDNCLRFLHTIQRNAERMHNLVNDISELSAIESGQVRLAPERLPLRQLVDEIFAGLAPRSAKQHVTLRNQVAEDCFVNADRRRLEQIITNLVDNAIKFNFPGGAVTVSAITAEHHIIKVRDTGPGIAPEHLPRVFERFYRADKARSHEMGGTGLGLAIVKHLALAHGGEASVASAVGEGSEFAIKLPKSPV